jgi:gluconate 2-dehydrogenase gamma chain
MNRREALRRTAMLMGGALSAPAIMGVLNGCTAKPTLNWKPEFFTADEAALLTRLSDIIIPKTETPGASEVGVPSFMDKMLKDVYSKEQQETFRKGLKDFNDRSVMEMGDPFNDLGAEDQESFVKKVHLEAAQEHKASKAPSPRSFMMMAKELTLLGYFTSEAGATQTLQYVAVPGAYDGCVPLSEAGNGKTWAV